MGWKWLEMVGTTYGNKQTDLSIPAVPAVPAPLHVTWHLSTIRGETPAGPRVGCAGCRENMGMILIWLFNNGDNNHMGENGDNIHNGIAMFMCFFGIVLFFIILYNHFCCDMVDIIKTCG